MKIKDLTNEQLIEKESKMRDVLFQMQKEKSTGTKQYAQNWSYWFHLREAGVLRGVVEFFVPGPDRNDK
jgi:hypothetical protein